MPLYDSGWFVLQLGLSSAASWTTSVKSRSFHEGLPQEGSEASRSSRPWAHDSFRIEMGKMHHPDWLVSPWSNWWPIKCDPPSLHLRFIWIDVWSGHCFWSGLALMQYSVILVIDWWHRNVSFFFLLLLLYESSSIVKQSVCFPCWCFMSKYTEPRPLKISGTVLKMS